MNAVRLGLLVFFISVCGTDAGFAQSRTSEKQPVKQVSGGGIFGRFLGKKPDDDGRRVIEPAPQTEAPDWTGVPFHKPTPNRVAGTNQPLTDPRDPSNRNRALPRAEQVSKSAIPVPPSEKAVTSPANSRSAIPSQPAPIRSARVASNGPLFDLPTAELDTRTFEPLSDSDSSRRSRRRSVDTLDAQSAAASRPENPAPTPQRSFAEFPTVESTPPSAAQAATQLPAAEEPKVARRTLPSQNSSRVAPPLNSTPETKASSSPGWVPAQTTTLSIPPSLATTATQQNIATPQNTTRMVDAPASIQRQPTNSGKINGSPGTGSTANTDATPNGWIAAGETSSRIPAGTSLAQPAKQPAATGAIPPTSSTPAATTPTPTPQPTSQQLGVRAGNVAAVKTDSASPAVAVNTSANNISGEIPGLRVITSGPAEIPVRQGISYRIMIENLGLVDAPGAVVQIKLPIWVDVQGHQPTRGEVGSEDDKEWRHLLWMVEGLPAASREELVINLSATEAREFDVHTEWAVMPQFSIAHVKVREPKLELLIEGPDQITYGESETFKVRVLNPGNGPAESVVFTLSPNSATPQSQQIGMIPEGKEAQFEVELTAQDMEDLQIHGLAAGEYNLRVENTKRIEVVRAELESVLSGPAIKYQDSVAVYNLQLSNLGRATSKNIVASLQLPVGVKYLGGIENARQEGGRLVWTIDQLPASGTTEYTVNCQMTLTGTQNLVFSCQGTAAGRTEVDFATDVEALADLVLTINDPPAPAPVGSEVVYEILVRNRGTKAAEQVIVLAQFGVDIEPIRIEGAKGEISPGQVKFAEIETLLPGQEISLKVFAKAENEGHHRFCTEVRCGDTLLIAEEATRYMQMVGQRISRRSGDK